MRSIFTTLLILGVMACELCGLTACQRQTYQSARSAQPQDAPAYTVKLDKNKAP